MSQPSTDATTKAPTILEKIYAQRAKDVELAKSTPGTTPEDIAALLSMHLSPPLIPLVPRLKSNPSSASASPSPSLMAEIKRASPSKGPINMTANAAQQAIIYALSGASVISVLTEPTWFKGSLLDMRLVRQAVDSLQNRPAILRKDFILDEYQIAEARLHGADTVLLIVAMLPIPRLQALYAYSLSLGMEPLVEVNNAREMSAALELGAKVIGVNNRNLHDFQVDMGTTSRLVEMVRERDVVLCALSGIAGPNDVRVYKEEGVRAVLVGEALMRAKDTGAFIRELLDWPESDATEDAAKSQAPLVLVSGSRTVDEAATAADVGADILGLVFVPGHEDCVAADTAAAISSAIRASRSAHVPVPQTSSPTPACTPWFTSHARNLASTPVRPLLLGIFEDQPLATILHTVAAAQLDLVQLQGAEPLEWARRIPVPVVRAFRTDEPGAADIGRPGLHAFALLRPAARDDVVDFTRARAIVGRAGTGADARGDDAIAHGHAAWPLPLILAGGLTPENVGHAVRTVGPWAVSVERSVLQKEGRIEAGRLTEFIAATKGSR